MTMENRKVGHWVEAEMRGHVLSEEQTVRADSWFGLSGEHCDSERKREGQDMHQSAPKKQKMTDGSEGEDEESELELGEGHETFGVVMMAPRIGQGAQTAVHLQVWTLRAHDTHAGDALAVPPRNILKNALEFVSEFKKTECDNREW